MPEFSKTIWQVYNRYIKKKAEKFTCEDKCKQKIRNIDKFLLKAPSYINKNNPLFNNTGCAAIPSKNMFVLYVSLEETASQKSKKDEDDVGFDNVCDSKGSTHSG